MPSITADAFLEALDLPSEHPYAIPQDNVLEHVKAEWSISSYFGSVAWTKDQPTSSSLGPNECEKFPSPSWARTQHGHVTDRYQEAGYPANNSNAVDFLEEIRPCLVSMFKMNIILWAPLILAICLKKLYFQKRALRQLEPDCSAGTPSLQANQKRRYLIASYAPSLRKATMARDEQRRQASEPYQNNSFERLLLLLSLFFNAISVMASFSTIFSIEEKNKDAKTPNPNDSNDDSCKKCRHSESICDAQSEGTYIFSSEWMAYVVALIFSAVIMNDAMYVLEFTQSNLVALHLFVISISLKRFGSKLSLVTALPISAIAFYIMAHLDLDLPSIQPGLYYDETNPFISEAVQEWPVDKRTYDDGRGTPWMMTGDTRTGLPFMVNNIQEQNFVRRWVPLPEENEAVILDIAFPDSMEISTSCIVYLVLHGINGNSNEGYVVDFAHRQVAQGNIVAVMVTRGLGDSSIVGHNILNFARVSDVNAAAKALKRAINQVGPESGRMLLAGVGYSMGAITLANYVASDSKCDLEVAIAISGSLDTTQQPYFQRSASLWQPFVAKAMRDALFSKYSRQIRHKLDQEQLKEVMKAKSMVDLDRALFVPYHDFESLDDYYSQMGAMADWERNRYEGRISNVSIPLLCIQALDDVVGYWKTFHDPTKVSKSGDGNTVLLFTRTGGHVGWPLGWNPAVDGWRWMSDAASSFAESVDRVRRNRSL
ncbi:hypothetical protein ACHAXR_011674 [Thalassiosira sp. AJA248-18]